MKYTYTAVFTSEENGLFSINFPDIQGCYTTGNNITDAISMAQDVLCLTLYDLEHDNKPIPTASHPQDIKTAENEFISLIAVETETYHRYYENKSVKKTLTIPAWLNTAAENAHVNFSSVLQAALKEHLHIID